MMQTRNGYNKEDENEDGQGLGTGQGFGCGNGAACGSPSGRENAAGDGYMGHGGGGDGDGKGLGWGNGHGDPFAVWGGISVYSEGQRIEQREKGEEVPPALDKRHTPG